MNDVKGESPAKDLVLDYDLDAPPEKVWRARSRHILASKRE